MGGRFARFSTSDRFPASDIRSAQVSGRDIVRIVPLPPRQMRAVDRIIAGEDF